MAKKVFVVQNGQVVEKPKRVLRAVSNAVSSESEPVIPALNSEKINVKNKKETAGTISASRHIPTKAATETETTQWVRPPDVDPAIVYKQDNRVPLIIPLLRANRFKYVFRDMAIELSSLSVPEFGASCGKLVIASEPFFDDGLFEQQQQYWAKHYNMCFMPDDKALVNVQFISKLRYRLTDDGDVEIVIKRLSKPFVYPKQALQPATKAHAQSAAISHWKQYIFGYSAIKTCTVIHPS